jgi:hypothetical protein
MPTLNVLSFPQATVAVGSHTVGPVLIADDAVDYVVEYDVSLFLDPESTLEVTVEISLDDGATWLGNGGASREGGVGLDKNGNPMTTASLYAPLFMGWDQDGFATQDPELVVTPATGRQVRGTLVVSGSSVTVGPGTVTIS